MTCRERSQTRRLRNSLPHALFPVLDDFPPRHIRNLRASLLGELFVYLPENLDSRLFRKDEQKIDRSHQGVRWTEARVSRVPFLVVRDRLIRNAKPFSELRLGKTYLLSEEPELGAGHRLG